ncbi:HNH endonuclease signature motif containing protein [Streptomyces violaceoruber]|uniref:HNH endonuclease signature motif containing protein n=1 Tax=Streptomyces violaceoruber group TaxID=2867121 RepID=UPI0033D255A5
MPDNVEVVVFKGVKFRRYPDSKSWAERAYFTPGIADRQKGVRRLHEEIWKAHNGEIPEGSHIHHRDHDHLNNAPDNLVCLTHQEHRRHHGDGRRGQCSDEQRAHLERIQPLTAAWHGSDEGRAWHSEHARKQWAERQPAQYICEHCSGRFETTDQSKVRFCSNKCKAAWRRASGVDDVDRVCAWCSATFRTNKYSKAETCSKSCGMKRSHAARN